MCRILPDVVSLAEIGVGGTKDGGKGTARPFYGSVSDAHNPEGMATLASE